MLTAFLQTAESFSESSRHLGCYGRTDLGGSEVLMMQSLKKLKQDVDGKTLVYPGHDYCGFKMGEFFF